MGMYPQIRTRILWIRIHNLLKNFKCKSLYLSYKYLSSALDLDPHFEEPDPDPQPLKGLWIDYTNYPIYHIYPLIEIS